MSDPVTDVEIEDVLSSIRRLVGDDHRVIPKSVPDDEARKPPRLVLTPSLLVPAPDVAEVSSEGLAGNDHVEVDAMDTDIHADEVSENDSDIDAQTDEPTLILGVEDEVSPQALEDVVSEQAGQLYSEELPEIPDYETPDHETPDHETQDHKADDHEALEFETHTGQDDDTDNTDDDTDDVFDTPEDHSDEDSGEVSQLFELPEENPPSSDAVDLSDQAQTDADVATEDGADMAAFDTQAPDPTAEDATTDEADTRRDPEDDVPYSTATLGAKIAALEAKIGQTNDQWEPDGELGDDYAGTHVETIEWQDHEEEDFADTPAIETGPETGESAFATQGERDFPAEERATRIPESDDSTLDLMGDDNTFLDEESLRELVADIVRQELQGALGERITRNVRKLVRREIHRALTAQELD